jgi:hypothetical protein
MLVEIRTTTSLLGSLRFPSPTPLAALATKACSSRGLKFLRHGGREGNVVANWQKDGLYFRLTTQLHDDFTLEDFQAVLESVR